MLIRGSDFSPNVITRTGDFTIGEARALAEAIRSKFSRPRAAFILMLETDLRRLKDFLRTDLDKPLDVLLYIYGMRPESFETPTQLLRRAHELERDGQNFLIIDSWSGDQEPSPHRPLPASPPHP